MAPPPPSLSPAPSISSGRLRPPRLSIQWKILIPVVGIVLTAFLGYAVVGLRTAERIPLERNYRSAGLLAAALERPLRAAVLHHDEAALHARLAEWADLPQLKTLGVVRPTGAPWVGAHGPLKPDADFMELLKRAQEGPGTAARAEGPWRYRVVKAIRAAPNAPVAGYLLADVSVADPRQSITSERAQWLLVSGGTLLLLAFALVVVVHVLVSRPLEALTTAMSRVEAGDYAARADITSGDELERLSRSFNRMVEEVAHANAEVTRANEQLLRTEKLASIGLLAAGVAHEINNPVATISMSAEGLMETETSPERRRFLHAIIEESERIGRIVKNLLGFERGGHNAYAVCSLTEVLRHAEDDVRRDANQAGVIVALDTRLRRDRVLGQADQLRQAFVNIMDNAIRAMEGGGRLDILAEERDGRAFVIFRDTGPGISREHQARVFDPFFTTREVGEGFGLGLAACYEIMKRHGGDISCESDSEGATFTVELPLSEGAATPPSLAEATPNVSAGPTSSL